MKTYEQLTDEVKQLIQLNASSEDFKYIPGNFDKNESGQWGYIIDWGKISERDIKTCLQNIDIISERNKSRQLSSTPLVGDYLEMPDGSMSRLTYLHEEGAQDGGGSGSFFLHKSGNASYSGGLNSSKPYNKMKDTGNTKKALFWIFSNNRSGANRGFYFYIDVKVWKIDAMLKTVYVKFEDHKYNYHTSINGNLSDNEIKEYFINKPFNLGAVKDDIQKCIDCAIYY